MFTLSTDTRLLHAAIKGLQSDLARMHRLRLRQTHWRSGFDQPDQKTTRIGANAATPGEWMMGECSVSCEQDPVALYGLRLDRTATNLFETDGFRAVEVFLKLSK